MLGVKRKGHEVDLVKAHVGAYLRTSKEKVDTTSIIADKKTKERLRMAAKPPKVSSALRKAGAALILAPDPITAVPGVAMLAASVVAKKKEPAAIEDVVKETAKALRDLSSLL